MNWKPDYDDGRIVRATWPACFPGSCAQATSKVCAAGGCTEAHRPTLIWAARLPQVRLPLKTRLPELPSFAFILTTTTCHDGTRTPVLESSIESISKPRGHVEIQPHPLYQPLERKPASSLTRRTVSPDMGRREPTQLTRQPAPELGDRRSPKGVSYDPSGSSRYPHDTSQHGITRV